VNAPLVDSNYIIALVDKSDSLHYNAVQLESELSRFDRIVPDILLIEAVSVLARRFEEKRKSEQFSEILASLNSLFPPDELLWLSPMIPRQYRPCLAMMDQYQGKLNFNDCALTLYMLEKSLKYIVSFDKDFDEVGGIQRIKAPLDVKALRT
jgi:predicted nucleic acid-binding protein